MIKLKKMADLEKWVEQKFGKTHMKHKHVWWDQKGAKMIWATFFLGADF